ncbi:MAG: HAD-IC family P-type ATPase [Alphaproteobacteria bacterium]|nr:HAD-IC family P-type ATPase [Alphaproteobacteria bacterium]
MPCEAVLSILRATPEGLSATEARHRLDRYGPNRLPAPRPPSALRRFILQFNNVLIYVLLGAAVITIALDDWIDTGVILAVVLINALIGFVQEGKAQHAIDAVRDMLSLHAVVLRDGTRREVDAAELVPGDIVFLQSGDKVPADVRLLRAKSMTAVEAALTGESVPVDKTVEPARESAALGDRRSMAYAGTLIGAGQGAGVVVATGLASEIGKVSRLLAETSALETPLLARLAVMGRWLTAAVLLLAALTFAIGALLQGFPAAEMFLAAVGLTVAAIPEGLPAVITIALAVGVQRMARRNAIIRRLPAVETLGSVTVICTDKTGTLTRNELTVRSIVTPDARYETTGVGYDPRGEIKRHGTEAPGAHDPGLRALLKAAVLCNDASLRQAAGSWQLAGDPTEGALLSAGMKVGIDPAAEGRAAPRLDEIPFDAAYRFMATLHQTAGGAVVYLKGAPEAVLEICANENASSGPHPIHRPTWRRTIEQAASDGRRVLALASKNVAPGKRSLSMADTRDGFTLLGLVAMIDPPREEAVAAVAACRDAGIRVAMITGDHDVTALAIARELGIDSGRALTGSGIDALDGVSLNGALSDTSVFARADPAHKLRLVQALQADGQVVAMTGDGVNDAPALKRADVGVAMGQRGTEAAREAAQMVLADDNFATIAHAVREGRAVYDNIRKSLAFMLPTDLSEALLVALAVIAGGTLPVTPVQILWVNLVTSTTLSLPLVFEPAEPDAMRRPPRPPTEGLLTAFLGWRILFVGLLTLGAVFALFHWHLAAGHDLAHARTVAVNAVVACEVFYLLSARFLLAPGLSMAALPGIWRALAAMGLTALCQLGFTYLPAAQAVFGTVPLGLADWGPILAAGLLVMAAVELEKLVIRMFKERSRQT